MFCSASNHMTSSGSYKLWIERKPHLYPASPDTLTPSLPFMTERSDRTSQNSFELQHPSVLYDFLDASHVKLTIPKDSGWTFRRHWHTSDSASCVQVTSLGGRLKVHIARPPLRNTGSFDLPPGDSFKFTPGDHHYFGPSRQDEGLVVILELKASEVVLFRNTCSATLDAQLYPFLTSTPSWIRLFFWMLRVSPKARQHIIAILLWVHTDDAECAWFLCLSRKDQCAIPMVASSSLELG